jgi:transposase-like protein
VFGATSNTVTDKLIPELKAWQQRPLEWHYPFVWFDVIHYKIKDEGPHVNNAIYTAWGLYLDDTKEVLGLYLSENEGASFWQSVLTDMNNRGAGSGTTSQCFSNTLSLFAKW